MGETGPSGGGRARGVLRIEGVAQGMRRAKQMKWRRALLFWQVYDSLVALSLELLVLVALTPLIHIEIISKKAV